MRRVGIDLPSRRILCIKHTVHLALVHQGAAVTVLGFLLVRWNAEDATEKHLVPSPLTIVEPKMLMEDAAKHAARVTFQNCTY